MMKTFLIYGIFHFSEHLVIEDTWQRQQLQLLQCCTSIGSSSLKPSHMISFRGDLLGVVLGQRERIFFSSWNYELNSVLIVLGLFKL